MAGGLVVELEGEVLLEGLQEECAVRGVRGYGDARTVEVAKARRGRRMEGNILG